MQYVIVDLSLGKVTAITTPAILKLIRVNTVLSAHVCSINDGLASVIKLKSAKAADEIEYYEGGIEFPFNIVVAPAAGATGEILLGYEEYSGRNG